MDIKEMADNFLHKYNQHPDQINIGLLSENMIQEMKAGLAGQPSSLAMIPTYLSSTRKPISHDKAIAIDAGGTNFRIGLVSFHKNQISLSQVQKRKMFGTEGAISYEDFISQLCSLIQPYLRYTNKIGFCFSFGAKIQPDGDGLVYEMSKNVDITGISNQLLGKSIKAQLKKMGFDQSIQIVILNDTVATLLGGPSIENPKSVDGQLGIILGTGTNIAYEEKICDIGKLNIKSEDKMIINTESAAFNKFEMGEFEKRIDAKSTNPGHQVFEKCISGAYLGGVISETVKQAASEGVFSKFSKVAKLPEFGLIDVDSFLRKPYGDNLLAKACGNDYDVELLTIFADAALERAAKMVTANLASCMVRSKAGDKYSAPAMIVAEGSTFYKCFSYKEKIEYYMRSYVQETLKRHYRFVSGDDVNMIGSALAVILNAK